MSKGGQTDQPAAPQTPVRLLAAATNSAAQHRAAKYSTAQHSSAARHLEIAVQEEDWVSAQCLVGIIAPAASRHGDKVSAAGAVPPLDIAAVPACGRRAAGRWAVHRRAGGAGGESVITLVWHWLD